MYAKTTHGVCFRGWIVAGSEINENDDKSTEAAERPSSRPTGAHAHA